MIGMYLNEAQDEEQHRQVANGLSLASPYIGSKNYVELDNGDVVYLPMTFETTAEMVGDLRVKKTSGEEEILDEAANLIYCSNGLAVYYNKLDEDGKLQQIRYKDGQLSPMSEVAGQENIVAVKTSADDTLLQVLQLDDERNTIGGGYLYNGQLHLAGQRIHCLQYFLPKPKMSLPSRWMARTVWWSCTGSAIWKPASWKSWEAKSVKQCCTATVR